MIATSWSPGWQIQTTLARTVFGWQIHTKLARTSRAHTGIPPNPLEIAMQIAPQTSVQPTLEKTLADRILSCDKGRMSRETGTLADRIRTYDNGRTPRKNMKTKWAAPSNYDFNYISIGSKRTL